MADASLRVSIWVKAQIKICDLNFLPIAVLKKGDPDAGTVLLKLNRLDLGIDVLSQVRTTEGKRAWMSITNGDLVNNDIAVEKIQGHIKLDPDVWVLEIEDPNYRYKIEDPII